MRATKLVDGLGDLEYHERLKRLQLPTLVYRRKRGDMIEMYKHFHVYDRQILATSFQPRDRPSRQHPHQLHTLRSYDGKRGPQTNSYYHRVVKTWNELPKEVVTAESINSFKNKLGAVHKGRPAIIGIFRPPLPRVSGIVLKSKKNLPPGRPDIILFSAYEL